LSIPENLEIPPVSVPVENILQARSVCQNTSELHLIKSPPKALKSIQIQAVNLAYPDPKILME
jgi:hypothetical protein